MEIRNNRNYYRWIAYLTLISFTCFAGVQLFSKLPHWITIIWFLFTELILLSDKFTISVSVHSSNVIIDYYVFLLKKQIVFPIEEMRIEMKKEGSLRSPPHAVLVISRNGKKLAKMDSSKGFQELDLHAIKRLLAK